MDFPQILKKSILKRKLTYADFAAKVGSSHGLPGAIIAKPKRKTPTHIPDGDAEKWADVLGLEDDEKAEFLAANAWHYASEDQRKVYEAMRERIAFLIEVASAVPVETRATIASRHAAPKGQRSKPKTHA